MSRLSWTAWFVNWRWTCWRWPAMLRSLGWRAARTHFLLQATVRTCSLCGRLTLPREAYFSCARCEVGYELCRQCHDRGGGGDGVDGKVLFSHDGRHRMVREVLPLNVSTRDIERARCTSEAIAAAFDVFGPRPCLGWRPREPDGALRDEYAWLSYGQAADRAFSCGAGLELLLTEGGNTGGKRSGGSGFVGLLGAVSIPWLVTDNGCILKGIPVVLMHRATDAARLSHVIDAAGVEVLVASRHLRPVILRALAKMELAGADIPLRHLVWIDDDADSYALQMNEERGWDTPSTLTQLPRESSWDDVCAKGSRVDSLQLRRVATTKGDTVVKLLTSGGTTGSLSKLIVVTDAMMRRRQHQLSGDGTPNSIGGRPVIVLAYEVMRQSHEVLLGGGSIGLFSGSLERIAEDCRCLRPTVFAATPTFWNGLFSQYEHEVREAQRRQLPEKDKEDTNCIADEVALRFRERKMLGNRVRVLISTGAPLSHRVHRWLFRVMGCMVIDAYGASETGGICTNGTVAAGVEVRLLDCPQLGFTTADRPHPRGEILVRSPLTGTYFTRERCHPKDGTVGAPMAESEADWVNLSGVRYFRTGDIGELVGRGQLRIIDRCKSFFKLSQGIFVAPGPVEAVLGESPYVAQIFVWGNGLMNAVAAVVVPTELLCSHLQEQLRGKDQEQCQVLSRDCVVGPVAERASQVVLNSLQQLGAERGLKPWEIPQKVVLEHERFSEWNGLLSSVGKHRRPALIRRYRRIMTGSDRDSMGVGLELYSPYGNIRGQAGLCSGLVEVLREITATTSGSALKLAPEMPLLSLGLDSMAVARLSSRLYDRFGVTLSPRVLYTLPTLSDIEAAVFGSKSAIRRGIGQSRPINWDEEATCVLKDLDENIDQLRRQAVLEGISFQGDQRDVVLLTGATGFLGAFLLKAITDQSNAPSFRHVRKVACLVRAATDAAAYERLKVSMDFYGLWDAKIEGGVVAIAGDLAKPLLGMGLTTFCNLSSTLRGVVHCGAQVSSVMPYEALRGINVVGTRRVIELAVLAEGAADKCDFCYVSTMGVVPPGQSEAFHVSSERFPAQSGYVQSKFVAEKVACEATKRCRSRVRTMSIFRPGVIAGHSLTGASNTKDAVNLLFCGLVAEQMVCLNKDSPLPWNFNLCPVDYVSAAIIRICGFLWMREANEGSRGMEVFHLCSPTSVSFLTLVNWMRDAGHTLTEVTAEEFRRKLRAVSSDHPLFALKSTLVGTPAIAMKQAWRTMEPPVTDKTTGFLEAAARADVSDACFDVGSATITESGFVRSLAFLLAKQQAVNT